jgi:periplasmic protein CpxP/Spy
MTEDTTTPRRGIRGKRRFLSGLLTGTLAGALLATGAGVFAHAREDGGGPRCHGMHGRMGDEAMRDRAAHMADRMLSKVDATADQKTRVKTILAGAIDDLGKLRTAHQANRDAAIAALSAETIDRDRLEVLRAAEMVLASNASERITRALADAAEVLTPAQRKTFAEMAQHFRRAGMPYGLGGPGGDGQPDRPKRS